MKPFASRATSLFYRVEHSRSDASVLIAGNPFRKLRRQQSGEPRRGTEPLPRLPWLARHHARTSRAHVFRDSLAAPRYEYPNHTNLPGHAPEYDLPIGAPRFPGGTAL